MDMINTNRSMLLVGVLTVFHPAASSAQGRGWRWFQSCATPTTMVLEARLDSASVFRTTFPACFLENAPSSTKILRFHFTPGRAVAWPNASVWRDGDVRGFSATTRAGRALVAQIHEQGTNTSGSNLGVTIGTKDSVTPLDTVLGRDTHNASVTDQVLTELVPGFVLVTYPLRWEQNPQARVDTTGAQCLPPDRGTQLLSEAVKLLSGSDSGTVRERRRYDLPRVGPSRIHVVQDSSICRRAAAWYAKYDDDNPEADSAKTAAAPFAVVQADSILFVEHASTAGRRGCCWLVMVIDLKGEFRHGYAAGL